MLKILTALALMLTPVAAVAQSTTMVDLVEERITVCKKMDTAIQSGQKAAVERYVNSLSDSERTVLLSICYSYLRGKQDQRDAGVSRS